MSRVRYALGAAREGLHADASERGRKARPFLLVGVAALFMVGVAYIRFTYGIHATFPEPLWIKEFLSGLGMATMGAAVGMAATMDWGSER